MKPLTDSQRAALECARLANGLGSWDFGAATLSWAKKLGLVEPARDPRGTLFYVITEAGAAVLSRGGVL